MKNLFNYVMIIGFILVGCNPNQDIYDEIALNAKPISGDVAYTLTEEDYTEELELRFPNFGSEDEAKELIPILLEDKYPALKDGSSAFITYALYSPKREERSLIRYTVSNEDYAALGHTFGNFDRESEIIEFLEYKYPNPEDRVLVSLTYDFYNGSTNTLNTGYLFINDTWEEMISFSDDEYTLMGERFPNFSNEDEATLKTAIILKDKLKFDGYEAGDIVGTMYKLYTTDVDDLDEDGRTDDSTTYSYVKYFIYDGENWSEYNDVINQVLQFGYDGEQDAWVPDNTIKYTLVDEDISFISSTFIDKYPGPADNVGFFGSFDRRSSSSNYWNDDMLLEAFSALLNKKQPEAEEGQKYVLTYVVYTGATGTESMSLIKAKNDSGELVWKVNK
ncbi:hypothetical protein KFZ70_06360 [Tamlana fucoidanivorans]|uniref:DUF5017 domain-containing protein n=1 Tax=Allotamlana fucoidanivorans TaxID=2583814 RepID=A0A5C4SMP7_9FLAO|nr:hypothetical protein [Tamlana fucoidanivorans]TNJ45366.1 hypothetical protein FGF67_06550 [Tamlana fucoidanivorans]